MTDTRDRIDETETREVIMEATFRALSKRGYNDLRMRDIGEEMDLTRQVIHYHFDGKDDLLESFLEYISQQYEGSVEVDPGMSAREELAARIDQCIYGPGFEGFSHWDRMKVYHDLYAQAKHDERHREIFDDHYRHIRDSIVGVIEEGIESGEFQDVDAEALGELITDAIHMARERRISLGQDDAPDSVRWAIDEYLLG